MKFLGSILFLLVFAGAFGQKDETELREKTASFIFDREFKDQKSLGKLYDESQKYSESTKELVLFADVLVKTRNREAIHELKTYLSDFVGLLKFINKWEKDQNQENLIIGYRSIARGLYNLKIYDYSILYFKRRLDLGYRDSSIIEDVYELADSHYELGADRSMVNVVINQYYQQLIKLAGSNDSLIYEFNRLRIKAYSDSTQKNYSEAINIAENNIDYAKSLSLDKQIQSYLDIAHVKVLSGNSANEIINQLKSKFESNEASKRLLQEKIIKFYYRNNIWEGLEVQIENYLENYTDDFRIEYVEIQYFLSILKMQDKKYKMAYKLLNSIIAGYGPELEPEDMVIVQHRASIAAEKMGKNKVALHHLQEYTKLNEKLREERIKNREIRNALQFYFQNAKNLVEYNARLKDYATIDEQQSEIQHQKDSLNMIQIQKEKAEKDLQLRKYFNWIVFILIVAALIWLSTIAVASKRNRSLLLNILPKSIADKLIKNKRRGKKKKQDLMEGFDHATILFTDFVGFTQIAEKLSPKMLVRELNEVFDAFDTICKANNLEKIKTIGDAYMAAGGIPVKNNFNHFDAVNAGLQMIDFINNFNEKRRLAGEPLWEVRIGINTGHIVAGVIGSWKYTYDVWGDAVNLASRMESSGEPGKVNISHDTYELVKDKYECTYRGEVKAKNKGMVKMYFVEGRKKA